MDAVSVLRQQLKEAHNWLEVTMEGVTAEQAHWKPQGKANPIAACYVHVVLAEDFLVNALFKGGAPLAASTWLGKTGISEMPPLPGEGGSWFAWGRRVRVDLPAARRYAEAVYESSDKLFESLKEGDLTKEMKSPAGVQTGLWLINNGLIGHFRDFTGEISCLKGLQGLKGYPF